MKGIHRLAGALALLIVLGCVLPVVAQAEGVQAESAQSYQSSQCMKFNIKTLPVVPGQSNAEFIPRATPGSLSIKQMSSINTCCVILPFIIQLQNNQSDDVQESIPNEPVTWQDKLRKILRQCIVALIL